MNTTPDDNHSHDANKKNDECVNGTKKNPNKIKIEINMKFGICQQNAIAK